MSYFVALGATAFHSTRGGEPRTGAAPRQQRFPGIARRARGTSVSLTALLPLLCAACALNYIDAAGDRHTIGFVDITVHPPAAPETFAGDVVEVSALGLIVSETAQGGYIALGYSHEATAALRNDVLVLGNPVQPLAPFQQAWKGNHE